MTLNISEIISLFIYIKYFSDSRVKMNEEKASTKVSQSSGIRKTPDF